MLLSAMIENAALAFKEAGIESARLDAELIAAAVLATDRHRLLTGADRELGAGEARRFRSLERRRALREPMAYLLGRKEFYSIDFHVDRRVLVPRPETELIVDLSLYYAPRESRFLDLGTGSGAIAVSVKHNRPDLSVFASDISPDAVTVARKNATSITGRSSVKFACGDTFAPWAGKRFSVIASNPPYVDRDALASLQEELKWEPAQALFAGERGRTTVARIVAEAGNHLEEGGVLLVEIGSDMKEFAHEAGSNAGFTVSVMHDYAGLPRVAVMKRIP